MGGDRVDFHALLSFTSALINLRVDEYKDDSEVEEGQFNFFLAHTIRRQMGGAAYQLAQGFSHAETQHRRAHNINGEKKNRQVQAYGRYTADRSRLQRGYCPLAAPLL